MPREAPVSVVDSLPKIELMASMSDSRLSAKLSASATAALNMSTFNDVSIAEATATPEASGLLVESGLAAMTSRDTFTLDVEIDTTHATPANPTHAAAANLADPIVRRRTTT